MKNLEKICIIIDTLSRYLVASAITGTVLLFTYETIANIFHTVNIFTSEMTCNDPIYRNECDKKVLEEILDFIILTITLILLIKSYFKPITWKTVFIHILYLFLGLIIIVIIGTEIMYSMKIWQEFIHSDQY